MTLTGPSMPETQQAPVGGFGCHTGIYPAAVLDPVGRLLGAESFAATSAGYRSTHDWPASFGPVGAVGVESTGSYGAALDRSLTQQGCRAIGVDQQHQHLRSRRGKNDAIDAEAAKYCRANRPPPSPALDIYSDVPA